jgi:RND family efflux transporter MFP subunit
LLAAAALALMAALAAVGIWSRDSAQARLQTWTDAQAIPSVSVVSPDHATAGQDVVLPGTIQAFIDAPLYARVPGYLKSWYTDIGAHVRRGDVLAVIETPDLDQQLNRAIANLASARADLRLADLTARRWTALLKTNSVSQQAADEKSGDAEAKQAAVQAAQAEVDRLQALKGFATITAPFDGVVTARQTDIGDLIDAGGGQGKALFNVSDMRRMRVYVQVPQAYAAELHAGLAASLALPQYPGVTFPARLATTANAINEQSRTVLVELLADNPQGRLWPGTFAQVTFELPPTATLSVPTSAVIFQEHGTQLALVDETGHVRLQNVTLGRDLGTRVEVLRGLGAGDRVIDSPPDALDNGDRVRVIDQAGAKVASRT